MGLAPCGEQSIVGPREHNHVKKQFRCVTKWLLKCKGSSGFRDIFEVVYDAARCVGSQTVEWHKKAHSSLMPQLQCQFGVATPYRCKQAPVEFMVGLNRVSENFQDIELESANNGIMKTGKKIKSAFVVFIRKTTYVGSHSRQLVRMERVSCSFHILCVAS